MNREREAEPSQPATRASSISLDEAIRAARAEVRLPHVAPAARAEPAPSTEHPGVRIDRYELVAELGEGGFGTVWRAVQTAPVQREVALKILKPGMDSKQVVARFEAERQALAMMDHPHIAVVLDGGTTATGRPYFVMELVDGVPITRYCDEHGLDMRQRLSLFVLVCRAVQHAHWKGVVHRDIKPTNVLVTSRDGEPVPKVIDFGVAKAATGDVAGRTLWTAPQQMIGTPEYMAPEQAAGGVGVDSRADVYGLGVLLYELLTGTRPFDLKAALARGYDEVLRTIREVEPARPSTRVSSLGEPSSRIAAACDVDSKQLSELLRGDLDWIALKALEKDRARRYATANSLADDVERHLAHEPVLASPPSRLYRLRKLVRRNRGAFAAVTALLLLLIAGTAGTTWGWLGSLRESALKDDALLEAREQRTEAVANALRAERELARASEIKRLVLEMIASIDPDLARTADVTLLRLIFDDTARRLSHGEIADELVAAELHLVVGGAYTKLGLYEEAEQHVPRARELRAGVLGPDDPGTVEAASLLAVLRMRQGRAAEAEPVFRRALELSRERGGASHPDALQALGNLGLALQHLGRYPEAEEAMNEALRLRRESGDTGRALADDAVRLAQFLQANGRYGEAEKLHREALAIREEALGTDHPETLQSMNGLANLFMSTGRLAEAGELYARTLELYRRILGKDHPWTLSTLNNYALLLYMSADFEAAEPLYREALATRTARFGEGHPQTLEVLMNLGVLLYARGESTEAEPLLERAVSGLRAAVGDGHPRLLDATHNLALVRQSLGETAEAEALFREVIAEQLARLGEEHPTTHFARSNLGKLLTEVGRADEAVPLLERVLELRRRSPGFGHRDTLAAATNLADAYGALGRHDEALALLREVLDATRATLGAGHPESYEALAQLGRGQLVAGRTDEALESLEASAPAMRNGYGLGEEVARVALGDLARCYDELGRADDALPLHRALLEHAVGRCGGPETSAADLIGVARQLLSHPHESLRDPAAARDLAERAVLATDARDADCLDVLAIALFETGDAAGAADAQRAALSLVPPEDAARRAELDARLVRYTSSTARD